VKKSINKTILTVCGLILASSALADGKANNGKKIYAKSECLRCHQTNQLFTRKDRKVKTLPQLNSQVRKCDAQLNTHLFHDEIEDVVAYLNQAHYKFPVKKKSNKKIVKEKTTKELTGD
jgi:mono/diheme cytochrome c family protein